MGRLLPLFGVPLAKRPPQTSAWPEQSNYKNMLGRCYQPKTNRFERYGGRGLGVCARWRASFWAFVHDMGPRPSAGHSIDRKDNDKGYDCGKCEDCVSRGAVANCRWATREEQAANRHSVALRLSLNGEETTIAEWCRRAGIRYSVVRMRLARGVPPEDALAPERRGPAQRLRGLIRDLEGYDFVLSVTPDAPTRGAYLRYRSDALAEIEALMGAPGSVPCGAFFTDKAKAEWLAEVSAARLFLVQKFTPPAYSREADRAQFVRVPRRSVA